MESKDTQLIKMYRFSLLGIVGILMLILFFAILNGSESGDVFPMIIIGVLAASPINALLAYAALIFSRRLPKDPESSVNSRQRKAKTLLWINVIPATLLGIWLIIMSLWGFDLGGVR